MNVLQGKTYKSSVSSVLNKDVKQHGKAFLFDGNDDTAWSSDQGTPQWILIKFEEPITISSFQMQFQGGFVGQNGQLSVEDSNGQVLYKHLFYPDDVNAKQEFKLDQVYDNISKLKFNFEKSSDFFGRIIIYSLEVY